MLKLLMKDVEFQWTESYQSAFEVLKANLSVAPILRGPDWYLPFHISIDSFDIAIGGVVVKKKAKHIRGNLGSKMGLIRKPAKNKFCELEIKNQ